MAAEAQILKAVKQLMEAHPVVAYCWRNSVGGATFHGKHYQLGEPGSSDLMGFTKTGKIIAIECKAPRGKLTKAQERFLERVKSAGGISGVVRSVEDAKAILDGPGLTFLQGCALARGTDRTPHGEPPVRIR